MPLMRVHAVLPCVQDNAPVSRFAPAGKRLPLRAAPTVPKPQPNPHSQLRTRPHSMNSSGPFAQQQQAQAQAQHAQQLSSPSTHRLSNPSSDSPLHLSPTELLQQQLQSSDSFSMQGAAANTSTNVLGQSAGGATGTGTTGSGAALAGGGGSSANSALVNDNELFDRATPHAATSHSQLQTLHGPGITAHAAAGGPADAPSHGECANGSVHVAPAGASTVVPGHRSSAGPAPGPSSLGLPTAAAGGGAAGGSVTVTVLPGTRGTCSTRRESVVAPSEMYADFAEAVKVRACVCV